MHENQNRRVFWCTLCSSQLAACIVLTGIGRLLYSRLRKHSVSSSYRHTVDARSFARVKHSDSKLFYTAVLFSVLYCHGMLCQHEVFIDGCTSGSKSDPTINTWSSQRGVLEKRTAGRLTLSAQVPPAVQSDKIVEDHQQKHGRNGYKRFRSVSIILWFEHMHFVLRQRVWVQCTQAVSFTPHHQLYHLVFQETLSSQGPWSRSSTPMIRTIRAIR